VIGGGGTIDPESITTLPCPDDAEPSSLRPGVRLGRYEVLMPVARGGMATIWAARVTGARGFQKLVAIKTIRTTLSDNAQFERMFLDEARIASRIRHPNVAEVLDLGEQDDVLYIVMEWVDGEPLVALMRKAGASSIPLPISVKIMTEAALGLHAAHQLTDDDNNPIGLVHRDVSPQNIMVTYDGIVKVVDFGVAKAAGRVAAESTTGQLKGKVPYMAPEQIMGGPIDRRADIFSLGTLIYQLTTGKHPFRAENDVLTLSNIVRRTVPPPHRVAQAMYPDALEKLALRALERDPEQRFATAAELARALDEVFPPGNLRASSEDVSNYVRALLGDGAARRAKLKKATERADDVRRIEESHSQRSLDLLNPREEISTRDEVIPQSAFDRLLDARSETTVAQFRQSASPPRRSRVVLVAAMLGALALGSGVALSSLEPESTPMPAASVGLEEPTTKAPAPSSTPSTSAAVPPPASASVSAAASSAPPRAPIPRWSPAPKPSPASERPNRPSTVDVPDF